MHIIQPVIRSKRFHRSVTETWRCALTFTPFKRLHGAHRNDDSAHTPSLAGSRNHRHLTLQKRQKSHFVHVECCLLLRIQFRFQTHHLHQLQFFSWFLPQTRILRKKQEDGKVQDRLALVMPRSYWAREQMERRLLAQNKTKRKSADGNWWISSNTSLDRTYELIRPN